MSNRGGDVRLTVWQFRDPEAANVGADLLRLEAANGAWDLVEPLVLRWPVGWQEPLSGQHDEKDVATSTGWRGTLARVANLSWWPTVGDSSVDGAWSDLVDRARDAGFDRDEVEDVRPALRPGMSALVAVTRGDDPAVAEIALSGQRPMRGFVAATLLR